MLNPPPRENIPAYQIVQRNVLEIIQENKLHANDRLPSESELAERHQVSIGTVKKALGDLVSQGVLYRRQGKGTFVSGGFVRPDSTRIYKAVNFFDEEEEEQGSEFISNVKSTADSSFARATDLPQGTPIFILRRIIRMGATRFAYLISHMRADKLPGFEAITRAEFEKSALYVILDKRYGIHNLRLRELLSVTPADADAARYLDIPQNTPVLRSDLLFKTYNGEPYEYRVSFCRTDRLKLFREF